MINIIGGGPIGLSTAAELSTDFDVKVFEENTKVGLPIQCTGILSNTIHEVVKIKKNYIANKIYHARIHSPDTKTVNIKFRNPNIIVFRDKFDQSFIDVAEKNGAKIYNEKRLVDKNTIQNLKSKRTTKFKGTIVGADGPLSATSKIYGLGNRKYLMGVQALIKKKNDGGVDFYPHIGTYAWSVPQSDDVLRVGVAAKTNSMQIFKEFKKKFGGKMLGWQGGLIPIHEPTLKTQKGQVFLVGDAAAQIKNTTGGGIIPGLKCSKILADSIKNYKKYDLQWRKGIGKDLYAHYVARKAMDRFTEKDWNELIHIFKDEYMEDILGKESRDKPLRVMTKVMMKKPQVAGFLKRLVF